MQRSLTVRFLQSNMGLILQVSLISFFHAQHEIKEQLYLLFLTACDHAYLSFGRHREGGKFFVLFLKQEF